MEETVRRVTTCTSLRSVLRLQAVFEGGEEAEIFLNSRAYIKGESSEFYQVPEPKGKLGIFPNPKTYMRDERSEYFQVPELIRRRQLEEWHHAPCFTRCFANRLYLKEEETPTFFQVPRPIWGGRDWNFSKSHRLYRRKWPLYRGTAQNFSHSHRFYTYFFIFFIYFFILSHISSNFPHIPLYFPHISSYFPHIPP